MKAQGQFEDMVLWNVTYHMFRNMWVFSVKFAEYFYIYFFSFNLSKFLIIAKFYFEAFSCVLQLICIHGDSLRLRSDQLSSTV